MPETALKTYNEKLVFRGTTLPDPLHSENRSSMLKDVSPDSWPNIKVKDVHKYLLHSTYTYSKEKIESKVDNILAYTCPNTKVTILTCEIRCDGVHLPWIATETNGVVLTTHCSCMTSLKGVCFHIESLLWAVTVKREGNCNEKETLIVKKLGLSALKVAVISVGVLGGMNPRLPVFGFTPATVAARYLASAILSGPIAAGSLFVIQKSIGAVGLDNSTRAVFVVSSTRVAALTLMNEENKLSNSKL